MGVKTGKASAAAVRFRKGQYGGRWLCITCGQADKSKGQIVETLYVADPKGKDLGDQPAAAGAPAESLPNAEAQQ